MKIYKTKTEKITGKDYPDLYKKAFNLYKQIKQRTKRKSNIRSIYFRKDKIFLESFGNTFIKKTGEIEKDEYDIFLAP